MSETKGTSSDGSDEPTEALYDEHKKNLHSYVRRRLPARDIAQAEDVVQETFARTINHLNNGNTVRSPKAFLYTTARNVITSTVYRRRDRMDTDATEDMDEFAAEASACSPQRRAAAQQHLDALETAISRLPANYQEAFVRRRIWGESCREIAAAMDIKEHTVSTYVALGWQLLEEYCEAHGIELDKLREPWVEPSNTP